MLKPGGRVGISDLTRNPEPLPGLEGLMAWIACIGDAQPLDWYATWLESAGLAVTFGGSREWVLMEIVSHIRARLFLADVLKGLGKLDLPGANLDEANAFAQAASRAVQLGKLGYAILTAEKLAVLAYC